MINLIRTRVIGTRTGRECLLSGLALVLLLILPFTLLLRNLSAQSGGWRTATAEELKSVIPARAPVISERIETEFRTASGITDGAGHTIAGVVMITAGYSAEGKYSHYFLVQAPIRVGTVDLSPGDYVFGWTRSQDALKVSFYEAATGKQLGQVDAERNPSITRVESFRIWPPRSGTSEPHALIQIGRFTFPYALTGK